MGLVFQGNEFWLILLILLLLLGPSKLPALARAFGQAVREFKKAAEGAYEEPRPQAAGAAAAQAAPVQARAAGSRAEEK